MTKVARLYQEQGIRQPEIAERLNISQPRVRHRRLSTVFIAA